MKSVTALPSRRNSGLLTTENWTEDTSREAATISLTTSPVPIGTVLLLITTMPSTRFWPIDCAASFKAVRSAPPWLSGGVPTARKTNSAASNASPYWVVNLRRPS